MKKIKFFNFLVVIFCCLLFCSNAWSKDWELKDISQPYLGTYDCEEFYFAGENVLGKFTFLKVELKMDGGCVYYREKKSKSTKKIPFEYEYNREKKELFASGQWGIFKIQKSFPLKKGEIHVVIPIANLTLKAKFKK